MNRLFSISVFALISFVNHAAYAKADFGYRNFRYVECYSQYSTAPIARYILADYKFELTHPAVQDDQDALIANLNQTVGSGSKQMTVYNIGYGAPLVSLQCYSKIVVELGETPENWSQRLKVVNPKDSIQFVDGSRL